MARVLSGIQPTGDVHLGNWVGAISRWARDQQRGQFFCIVDLHAITIPKEPHELRGKTLDLATWLFAAGLDQNRSTTFVQSHVHEHAELAWILNCFAGMGELSRMTQFKDKSVGRDHVAVGLFTYPVLQAADILLYQAEEVPVGEDQRQHIELTRDLAQRFNHRYGREVFTLPKATFPTAGARIMDLQDPYAKMSKSAGSDAGTIMLGEDPPRTRKKIMRAVTDSGEEIRPGADKPGITNLLDLLAAVTGKGVDDLVSEFAGQRYGDFKKVVAEAANDYLAPARQRYAELAADPGVVAAELRKGAAAARDVAAATLTDVKDAVGFLPR